MLSAARERFFYDQTKQQPARPAGDLNQAAAGESQAFARLSVTQLARWRSIALRRKRSALGCRTNILRLFV
jgi:hypothetical protein